MSDTNTTAELPPGILSGAQQWDRVHGVKHEIGVTARLSNAAQGTLSSNVIF